MIGPSEILPLFVLTPTCGNKQIVPVFNNLKTVLLEKKKEETRKAYREVLKVSYLEIKDLDKTAPLTLVYSEIVNVASLIRTFCIMETDRKGQTHG